MPNSCIEELELNYLALLRLCDRLEMIADCLPGSDSCICLATADDLEQLIYSTHALEEAALFPLLVALNRAELDKTIARLRQEHLADSSTAGEVSEILRGLAAGRPDLSPDAIGYLLRSVFDVMRRHILGVRELMRLFLPQQTMGIRP